VEISELSDEISESCNSINTDLQKYLRMVTIIHEMESQKEFDPTDKRIYTLGPRLNLITRILDARYKSGTSSEETDSQLEKFREISKTTFPILTEVEIFNHQRMYQWPKTSNFEGQVGLAGQAYDFAFDRQMYSEPWEDNDLDSFLDGGGVEEKTNKMGCVITNMFLDYEALVNRSGLEGDSDTNVFVYIAAIAAAEHICVERFGTKVWSEVDDSVGHAAGTEKLEFIHRFMSELSSEIGENLEDKFFQMESSFAETIDKGLPENSDPNSLYVESIHAAEAFWVDVVGLSQSEAGESEQVIEGRSGDPGIEQRLARLASLLDKGDISELEYQRHRQRILGEV
jgi:hypothetical protein